MSESQSQEQNDKNWKRVTDVLHTVPVYLTLIGMCIGGVFHLELTSYLSTAKIEAIQTELKDTKNDLREYKATQQNINTQILTDLSTIKAEISFLRSDLTRRGRDEVK